MTKRPSPVRDAILWFINEAGIKGRRFSEIQKFYVNEIYGGDWEKRELIVNRCPCCKRETSARSVRVYRGTGVRTLLGFSSSPGILDKYCVKTEQGTWRIK